MRIVDALAEVLKDNKSLTYIEAYQKIVEKDLYRFGAKDPEAAVNAKLRSHCVGLDFPGASPVKYFKIVGKKGKRNLYALVEEDKDENRRSRESVTDADSLPEEKIDLTYLFYKSKLKKQILDHIINCHPSFFERLVVNLLLEMGYGSDELSGRVIGKSHDGGIDGVIYEDKLGLSKIYIQAKRYASSNKVSSEELDSFIGAMSRRKATKGVFITTSSFTKPAVCAAKDSGLNLSLVDGTLLCELMVANEIGGRTLKTISIYEIDAGFFS